MVFRTDPRGEGPVLPVQGAGRHRPHPRTLALGTGPGRLCQLLCAPHSVPWKEVVHTHPRRGAALPGDEDRAASGPGGPRRAPPLPAHLPASHGPRFGPWGLFYACGRDPVQLSWG